MKLCNQFRQLAGSSTVFLCPDRGYGEQKVGVEWIADIQRYSPFHTALPSHDCSSRTRRVVAPPRTESDWRTSRDRKVSVRVVPSRTDARPWVWVDRGRWWRIELKAGKSNERVDGDGTVGDGVCWVVRKWERDQ